MGFFDMKPKDDVKDPKTQVQPGGPVIVKEAPATVVMKPWFGLSVTDENPKFTTRLSFERRAIRDTLFKVHAAEATIANFKSYQGYAVEASRKDGDFPPQSVRLVQASAAAVPAALAARRHGA